MERNKWTERTFTFDFPTGWLYNILERLRGTVPRIRDMVSGLSEADLVFKPENRWSIKENIGHLCDLEDLHEGRLDDFLEGKSQLRAADMTNAKTHASSHNSQAIETLIDNLNEKRRSLILRLQTLPDQIQNSKALHPRLLVQMRPVDVAYFTAEHDDHHLADIREIIRMLNR